MALKTELYDNAYSHYELDVYQQIRRETYGEDFGQTSWVTNEESQQIPLLLELRPDSSVLEIGCGSGKYALSLTQQIGCRISGIDVNPHGIHNARQLARVAGLESLAHFEQFDASNRLPFGEASFDAVFSNDAICHIADRSKVFSEILRVLKRAGRLLFSDALVIGGLLSHEEIATRAAIGNYFFSPPGENERLLQNTGFELLKVTDTTESAASIAKRWHDARERASPGLLQTEGKENFEGLQRFLDCVRILTSEGRMLRFLYLAVKPG